jgi:hypothetical protein
MYRSSACVKDVANDIHANLFRSIYKDLIFQKKLCMPVLYARNASMYLHVYS